MLKVWNSVRKLFDVDNDRTWLFSEGKGTKEALSFAFEHQPAALAALWINDPAVSATPRHTTVQLGVTPWVNVGPGGNLRCAETLINAVCRAGYRVPLEAPYAGPGAHRFGTVAQFMSGLVFLSDKVRQ